MPNTQNDQDLIQIVDAAMAEAVLKSGSWLACRPGCSECCIGPFPITQLDARRLHAALAALEIEDPARANRVRRRARLSAGRISRDFPENPVASVLAREDAFKDEPCPALDPQTGTCDLYAARPITCRIFGPAVRFGSQSVAVCELCYRSATDEQIAACQVEVDPEDLESKLLRELDRPLPAETIVAFALAGEPEAVATTPPVRNDGGCEDPR
jgi:Fe-S-cluster containining protein